MSAPGGPGLLLLADTEHLVRTAPGFARIAGLADATALDVPLAQVPESELRDVRVLLAIRERTRLDRATLDRLPNLELVLQTAGHAYHVDAAAAAERVITVVLWRRCRRRWWSWSSAWPSRCCDGYPRRHALGTTGAGRG